MTTLAPATEHWTQSRDATRLFYRRWPHESPRAAVAIVHGYAEHSGRYDHVAAMLGELELDVFAIDVRGHGRSDGVRGHAADYREYTEDLKALLSRMRKESPAQRYVILGHSNGGLISLTYAIEPEPDVSALVISAPFLGTAMKVPAWKAAMGRLMSRIYPTLSMPSGLPAEALSHDPEVVRAYVEDPLVFTTATAGWFTAALAAMERVKAEASRITLPCLLMQGTGDRLVDPAQARPLFDALGSQDKRFIEYDGFYHEIMNETDKARVLADIRGWLESRV
jgi:alpha-beta hydrolase superfamily lysophospholipase